MSKSIGINVQEAEWLLQVYKELLVLLIVQNWEEYIKDPDLFILGHARTPANSCGKFLPGLCRYDQNSVVDRLLRLTGETAFTVKNYIVKALDEFGIPANTIKIDSITKKRRSAYLTMRLFS